MTRDTLIDLMTEAAQEKMASLVFREAMEAALEVVEKHREALDD